MMNPVRRLWSALKQYSGFTRLPSPGETSRWIGPLAESLAKLWFRNVQIDREEELLRNSAIYSCVTGIAGDISKMRVLLSENNKGIWTEVERSSPFLPVLRKPNHYQNRIKFFEQWLLSKLLAGNTYVLKRHDARPIVDAMYVLDPKRVTVLVSPSGDVYYELRINPLAGIDEEVVMVPASEIIHDRMAPLWHPLVGVSPLYACAWSATLSGRIRKSSAQFFHNKSLPGGVLSLPGHVDDDQAKDLRRKYYENFSGDNAGNVMILGDNMKFEALQLTAEASQLAEQFKLTVEDIARAFHYPLFKLGGPLPAYAGNVESLITTYYTDCLQSLIECIELSLDEGLALPSNLGTEFDLVNLMRMDTKSLFDANTVAVGGGWMAPDEARFRANLASTAGGNTPYLQQQNYSLAALAKRDAQPDPFAKPALASTEPKLLKADEAELEAAMEIIFCRELMEELAS